MAFRKILAPVDYSDNSRASLEVAAELAKTYSATLEIVHVWDRPTYITEAVMVGHAGGHRPLTELIVENAENDMKSFLAGTSLATAAVQTRLLSGDPATELLREIERGQYDLVVVGTHGRSGLNRLLVGSIAEKLVRHSPIPVLTIPRRG
jgi:nucleotide-binding universal stress UspA family protein